MQDHFSFPFVQESSNLEPQKSSQKKKPKRKRSPLGLQQVGLCTLLQSFPLSVLSYPNAAELSQQIAPLTAQTVNASTRVQNIVARVPVTIQYKYTCGKAASTEDNEIEITTSGVADAMASSFQVTYGTSYPIEPDIVYPQATQTCSSNPQCANLGFRSGNCCPNDDGVYNDCCSFCSIRPSCQGFASSSETMCTCYINDLV